jgi:hypothetical protein
MQQQQRAAQEEPALALPLLPQHRWLSLLLNRRYPSTLKAGLAAMQTAALWE